MTRGSQAVVGSLVVAGIACLVVAVAHVAAIDPAQADRTARPRAPSALSTDPAAVDSARTALSKYCVTCHNERLKTAGLTLDSLDVERAADRPEVWEKVAHKLRAHEMPPPAAPRPDESTYAALATVI